MSKSAVVFFVLFAFSSVLCVFFAYAYFSLKDKIKRRVGKENCDSCNGKYFIWDLDEMRDPRGMFESFFCPDCQKKRGQEGWKRCEVVTYNS